MNIKKHAIYMSIDDTFGCPIILKYLERVKVQRHSFFAICQKTFVLIMFAQVDLCFLEIIQII